MNVDIKEALMLSAPCIALFSRLKLSSIKHRFEEFCHEESKSNNLDTFLNPAFDFNFSQESNRLQNEISKHLQDCRVTEEKF